MEPSTSRALVHIKREPVVAEQDDHRPPPAEKDEQQESAKSRPKSFRDLTREQKILAIVRHSVRPFSDRLDPFAALPVNLDRFQEHLVSFYLLYYPKATYGFSPRLRPHPVASNFSIALNTPACFQVIMARSALYRITLNKFASEPEKKALEFAVMRHKGEALRLVRALSTKPSSNRKDDLLASIISLGTFDRRTGSAEAAGMHYQAVRRILKSTGGPLAVNSVLLSRVMCFFECIYGTSPESYIWDEADLKRLVIGLNAFLEQLREFWQSLTTISALTAKSEHERQTMPIHRFGFRPDSTLLALMERQPPPDADITPQRRLELIFQVTCLLTLATMTLDFGQDFAAMQTYMAGLHKAMDDLHLAGQSSNNAMWYIQVNDHSEAHSRRIWRAASYAWVMKHCTYNVQVSLKQWLLNFFNGKPVDQAYRLDPFHFSYAS